MSKDDRIAFDRIWTRMTVLSEIPNWPSPDAPRVDFPKAAPPAGPPHVEKLIISLFRSQDIP